MNRATPTLTVENLYTRHYLHYPPDKDWFITGLLSDAGYRPMITAIERYTPDAFEIRFGWGPSLVGTMILPNEAAITVSSDPQP